MADWMLALLRWILGGNAAETATTEGQGDPDPSANLGGIMIEDG